ncbi:MAG: phosphotransferase [Anaerolineae bacterium]|nr:phosphotransferase [Anaerolineae bacterium]
MIGASILTSQILPQYKLGEVLSVESVPGNLAEECHVVTTTQERIFIKRCSSGTTPEQLNAKHELIHFLVDDQFATPSLVLTRSEATWVEHNGQFYEAYQYIDGEPFGVGNRQQIAGVGRILGRYHTLVERYQPSLAISGKTSVAGYLDLGNRAAKPLTWLFKHHCIRIEERWLAQAIIKEIKEQVRHFRHEKGLVRLVVHGMVEPGNVLFDPSGEVISLADWAGIQEFVRVFDVANALLKFVGRRADATLPGQVGPLLSWPRVEDFARAYRESVILTQEEANLLPWLMQAIRLTDVLWIHEKYDLHYRYEFKLVDAMHTWLTQNGDILGDLFCQAR